MNDDPLRCTGRTTRMLNDAAIKFIEGWDVIVTAFTFQYSLDLQNLMCYKLECHHIPFKASKHIITVFDNEMIFTKHFDWDYRMVDSPYVSHFKTYLLFEDHHRGDY